jgi:hypothetical protein
MRVEATYEVLDMVSVADRRLWPRHNASPTGHEWNTYTEGFRTGYVLGFLNGTGIGAFREVNVCFQLTKISLDIVNTTNDSLKRWKEKYPDIVLATTSQILSQADRPEFKQDFCLKSFKSGFENITVGQFLSGVNAFYSDYRNQSIPVNYAIQYVRDDINGKSPAELNAGLLLERKCIADPTTCLESKPTSPR